MIVIDYVDGRGRTERISDSSTPAVGNNTPPSSGTTNSVTVTGSHAHTHYHHGSLHGTFVDSSSSSLTDDTPPPPPPRTHIYGGSHSHHHVHHSNSGNGNNNNPAVSGNKNNGNGGQQHYNKASMRSSHSSDSSSAYSGSDTMQSVPSSGGEVEEVDLSGLMESVVDSDEEEDLSETSLIVRDAVRECLEKDPSDRRDEDVDILLEFTQHLKAFTNMTMSVRRALVATMVFAVVEKAGTVVMTDGEELDSWSVIINGHVEIETPVVGGGGEGGSPTTATTVREMHLGDSFGITPTMDKLYHRGVMRTKCDDCQFVCVTQTDYYRILHQGEENQRRHEENGEVVLVTEHRQVDGEHHRRGHVVIRGSASKLMAQLMEDNSSVDATFIEDFLLTYRTFLTSPVQIMEQLLEWFKDPGLRDKVTRVLLLWVNNHFTDFETDPEMMEHLEKFEASLENEKMQGQLRMLNFACAAKARRRTVTLTRPSRDEPLQFSILGGYERGFGIFISKVEKGSKADEIGLKRGDQILEVNGQSFEHVTKHVRALEILKSVCHLSITVKSNLLAFNEMLHTPEDTPRTRSRGKSVGSSSSNRNHHGERGGGGGDLSEQSAYSGSEGALSAAGFNGSGSAGSSIDVRSQVSNSASMRTSNPKKDLKNSLASSSKSRINKAFNRFLHKPKSLMNMDTATAADQDLSGVNGGSNTLYPGGPGGSPSNAAMSNPDLLRDPSFEADPKSEYPEHVLKVYKADQTFKYLLVHKETTAHEVVMLSLQEFGNTEPSSNFTLCEVTVAEGGFVKQRRLPDALQNLAERIGLASRYYIKNVQSSESLLPDEVVADLMKDAQVNLLQLNPVEVSTQLMVEDFTIFRQIEATEFVEDLFEIKSRYGTPSLSLFSELVNREMMWTISEIVSEPNVTKRMRIIKQYIKVARQCKETQNFNSMFAIVSGLGHGAVSRLKASWEKVPTKYARMFHEMQQLMDPSRNMSRYRNLVTGEDVQPPIIPFYPVVKKDLTFIHLANDSKVEELINFEKLRMIAKEVRGLTNMCSAPLDLFSMLELGGQQPSNAMVAMNQLTAGGQYLATVNSVNRRRRKKASGVPNPKRMFEEAQMVRRVKAYLNNMKIITDEDRLHAMSLECEAPAGGMPTSIHTHAISQQSLRKRNPSPTPSAMSSTSSASHNSANNRDKRAPQQSSSQHLLAAATGHSKFGAASPHAVKKLLSLSEQSKTRPKSALGHHSHSPATPLSGRKGGSSSLVGAGSSSGNNGGGQQHSPSSAQGPNGDVCAVDLTAESSSVTSLPVMRKVHNTGSVTSTDSGLGFYDHHHHAHHTSSSGTSSSGTSPNSSSSGGVPSNDAGGASLNLAESSSSSFSRRHSSPRVSHHRRQQSGGRNKSSRPPPSSLGGGGGISPSSSSGTAPPTSSLIHHAMPIEVRPLSHHFTSSAQHRMIMGKGPLSLSSSTTTSSGGAPPPLPPHKSSSVTGPQRKTIPTYYVTEEDDEDDDETQVSAV